MRKCISGISGVEVTAIDVNYQNSVLKFQQCDRNEQTLCDTGRVLRLVFMLRERIFVYCRKEQLRILGTSFRLTVHCMLLMAASMLDMNMVKYSVI